MKHQSLVLLIVAALIALAGIVLLDSEEVIAAMCGAFLTAASGYTALDFRAVVKATQGLADGEYEVANLPKYYFATALLGTLFAACAIRQGITGIKLDLAIGLLGPGIIGIIAIIIGGLKCNKAVTGKSSSAFRIVIEPGVPIDNKIAVIKEIRTIAGVGLKEAKDLTEIGGQLGEKDYSRESAMEILERIRLSGGMARMIPC